MIGVTNPECKSSSSEEVDRTINVVLSQIMRDPRTTTAFHDNCRDPIPGSKSIDRQGVASKYLTVSDVSLTTPRSCGGSPVFNAVIEDMEDTRGFSYITLTHTADDGTLLQEEAYGLAPGFIDYELSEEHLFIEGWVPKQEMTTADGVQEECEIIRNLKELMNDVALS